MDIVDLDRHVSERLTRLKPVSAYGTHMPPPKLVQEFINRCSHPKTKESYHLLDLDWEEGPATRIIESLELYTQDDSLTMVKKRTTLHADGSDAAPSMFRMDSLGVIATHGTDLRNIRGAHVNDADHEDDGPTARQTARIDTLIGDGGVPEVTADNRTTLELHCALTTADVAMYHELVRVYHTTRRSATGYMKFASRPSAAS